MQHSGRRRLVSIRRPLARRALQPGASQCKPRMNDQPEGRRGHLNEGRDGDGQTAHAESYSPVSLLRGGERNTVSRCRADVVGVPGYGLPATEKHNAGGTQEAALCPQCAQARQPPSILRTIQLLRGAARTGDGDTGRPVRCRFPVAVPTVPTATATATACSRVLAVVYARPPAHCFVRAAGCWTGRKAAGAPRWSVRCECRSPSPVGGAGALHCIGYLDDGSDRGRAGFN